MAPPGSPAPFTVGGPMLNMIFQAASDGDLHLFKRLVTMLDMGRGRLKETVEALRVEDAGLLQGLGALHVATNRGRMEVCRYLVGDLQVDVNAVDKGGRTPLFFAISCKGVGIAKYLLDHGADPNKSCHNGLSPLHEATTSGDCETVKLLLAKGAYIDPVAFCGTPLHCAATQGHDGILKILLDHNADRNKEVNGKTPLIAAIDADSRNCMLLLIRAGADAKGALTYAVENLHSQKLVSTDFVNCIKEDAAADRVLPDDDEPVSKNKTRVAGFKKLANNSFKKEDYFSAAGSYSVATAMKRKAGPNTIKINAFFKLVASSSQPTERLIAAPASLTHSGLIDYAESLLSHVVDFLSHCQCPQIPNICLVGCRQ
ncbi:poly [ADP-ribose] polymerase tankyrase-2 [Triticum aestivum]|uniref:poly [ADP-ribose] polymerase tankyrase-2 n=1 Tax=Triticum aestivum TaxID=4565 RepID=UPI001D0234CA|nr:poly [ADP-ribose] polymerase tankyrase-2-like [Triticum aestivum]